MDVRTTMLEAAEALLDASPDRDVATRDVCKAAGVAPPVLYRLFGDKNGLLSAVVDHGFDRYLATKRAAQPSADPVEDLRSGWDTHVAFALDHPAVYRMMFSPAFKAVPAAAGEALAILRGVLERCAAAGALRADVDRCAQAIMAANVGLALSLITQPADYADPDLSRTVRDAVHRELLTEEAMGGARARTERDRPAVAAQLTAMLAAQPDERFSAPETALLRQWLTTLAD